MRKDLIPIFQRLFFFSSHQISNIGSYFRCFCLYFPEKSDDGLTRHFHKNPMVILDLSDLPRVATIIISSITLRKGPAGIHEIPKLGYINV